MSQSIADRQVVITRVIPFPKALVFEGWTQRQHLEKWYGPNGFTITTEKFDFREGGEWIFTMHGPDGTNFPNRNRWQTIEAPNKIHYLVDGGKEDLEDVAFECTVTFEDHAEGTLITLSHLFSTKEGRDLVVREYGAIEGGHQTLARLEALITTW